MGAGQCKENTDPLNNGTFTPVNCPGECGKPPCAVNIMPLLDSLPAQTIKNAAPGPTDPKLLANESASDATYTPPKKKGGGNTRYKFHLDTKSRTHQRTYRRKIKNKKKKWSKKYKKSINCKKSKGFSQKQYRKVKKSKSKRRLY